MSLFRILRMTPSQFIKRAILKVISKTELVLPRWETAKQKFIIIPSVSDFSTTLPANIASIPQENVASYHEIISYPERYLYTLNDVYVSYYGVVFKNLKIFIPSLVAPTDKIQVQNSLAMERSQFLSQQWSKKVITVVEKPIALVYELWSAINYYHWICDSLPRLLLLREKYPNCTLLVPYPVPDYVLETTRKLGFHKLLTISREQVLKVDTLIFPELTAKITMQNQSLINQVRTELLHGFKPTIISRPKRIYVSRSRARMRRLSNEDAVMHMLKRYDFEIIHFEDYSFLQQIELMSATEIFVGIHGANLTNLIFMPIHAHVIEFMNKDFDNFCYWRLSSNIHMNYSCIKYSSQDIGKNQENISINDDDLVVNIKELEEAVKAAL